MGDFKDIWVMENQEINCFLNLDQDISMYKLKSFILTIKGQKKKESSEY